MRLRYAAYLRNGEDQRIKKYLHANSTTVSGGRVDLCAGMIVVGLMKSPRNYTRDQYLLLQKVDFNFQCIVLRSLPSHADQF